MKVPFVDLHSQYKFLRSDLLKGVEAVFEKCNFVLGEEVSRLEADFAKYCGSAFGVGVASGTDALHLAVRAAGVGPGDEVLIPANTFIATALAVTYVGAKPIPIDVDAETFLMDVQLIEKAITAKTKAIIPVHLFGRLLDLDPVLEIARRHGLVVIEDAAQAHGAQLNGKRAGARGLLGCFSFYPGKNLGCYGDGGLITTEDPALKARLEALRNYGSPKKYEHPEIGYNSRLDTVQAAILNAKLPHLDAWNAARVAAALHYNQLLAGVGDLVLPRIPQAGAHVFHLYVIRTRKREALLAHLTAKGVGAGIHYPVPIHLHGAYAGLGFKKGDFPVAEQLSQEILSLPMFPELSKPQLHYVTDQLKSFFGGAHGG